MCLVAQTLWLGDRELAFIDSILFLVFRIPRSDWWCCRAVCCLWFAWDEIFGSTVMPPAIVGIGVVSSGCTQLALADGAGLSTVVDFEKNRRQLSNGAIESIFQALTRAGVEFIQENGGGPGVRLRKRQRQRTSQ